MSAIGRAALSECGAFFMATLTLIQCGNGGAAIANGNGGGSGGGGGASGGAAEEETTSSPKLPAGVEEALFDSQYGLYRFQADGKEVEVQIADHGKTGLFSATFTVDGSYGDETNGGNNPITFRQVQRVMAYDAARRGDGTKYYNIPAAGDTQYVTRVRAYEKGGFSQPVMGDKGEMYAVVRNGRITPDNATLTSLRQQRGISDSRIEQGRERLKQQREENRQARTQNRPAQMIPEPTFAPDFSALFGL